MTISLEASIRQELDEVYPYDKSDCAAVYVQYEALSEGKKNKLVRVLAKMIAKAVPEATRHPDMWFDSWINQFFAEALVETETYTQGLEEEQ